MVRYLGSGAENRLPLPKDLPLFRGIPFGKRHQPAKAEETQGIVAAQDGKLSLDFRGELQQLEVLHQLLVARDLPAQPDRGD